MKYLLTVRIPFDEMDDIEARKRAKEIIDEIQVKRENTVKLQKLQDNGEPTGMKL